MLNGLLQVVQRAQTDLDPEPDHQGQRGHQAGHERKGPQGQLTGKGLSVAGPLPDGNDRIAGQVVDGAAFDHAQDAHFFAPVIGHVITGFIADRDFGGAWRIGIAGHVVSAGSGGVVENLASARVRNEIAGAGRQRIPVGNRDVPRYRQSCGQKAAVKQVL